MWRFLIAALNCYIVTGFVSKSLFDPWENIWVTLGRAANTTTVCASLSTPSAPFVTCLIGVPLNDSFYSLFNRSLSEQQEKYHHLPLGRSGLKDFLNQPLNWQKLPYGPDPQELELVDSLNASYCIFFNSSKATCAVGNWPCNLTVTPVFPIGNETQWEGQWCQKVLHNKSHPVGVSHFPKRLPAGWFLICGNRAWNGIPARMMGGPCTIGQLSLALPHHHLNRSNPVRWKRDITETLDDTCDDNVRLWNKWEIIFASFFPPGVAAARAHRNLEK